MTTRLAYRTSTQDALVIRLADALSVPGGGFSYEPATRTDVTSGYVVAVHPDRERKVGGKVWPSDVAAYAFENAKLLAKPGNILGGWRNAGDGLAYLDISRVVATQAEAIALARLHNQLAYFDVKAGKDVSV